MGEDFNFWCESQLPFQEAGDKTSLRKGISFIFFSL
jgi:hypothetical protein